MATKKRAKKHEDEHNHLSLRITSFEARSGNGINHAAYHPENAYFYGDNDPIRVYDNDLIVKATCTWPEEREGTSYELTFHGEERPSRDTSGTLQDIQRRDEFRSPQWRPYRGHEIPIYDPPPGLGLIEKVRGHDLWYGTCWVDTRFVDTSLAILASKQEVYLEVHEVKIKRNRWIRSVSFQTTDPAEE